MRTLNKSYNSIFFSIFILLFFSLYFLRVNLFSYAIPLLIIKLILIIYILYMFLKNVNLLYFKNFLSNRAVVIFVFFFLLFILETFHFDYDFNYNLFANKQTCKNTSFIFNENEFLKFTI